MPCGGEEVQDRDLDGQPMGLRPWGGRSASMLWRDPSGMLRAFPRIEAPEVPVQVRVAALSTHRTTYPVLLPVYLAFFLHYLGGWQPFGACRGCLPLCRSQLVPRPTPPEAAAGLFNLGILAISMRMRMFPRRMWRRPPQGLFLIYKFFISLFIFEIAHSCIFKAVERTFYEALPNLCDAATSGSLASEVQWLLDASCGLLDTDWFLWLLMYALAAAFLWCALAAARLLSLPQLQGHLLLALSASAAVVYKARTEPHCSHHFWG